MYGRHYLNHLRKREKTTVLRSGNKHNSFPSCDHGEIGVCVCSLFFLFFTMYYCFILFLLYYAVVVRIKSNKFCASFNQKKRHKQANTKIGAHELENNDYYHSRSCTFTILQNVQFFKNFLFI